MYSLTRRDHNPLGALSGRSSEQKLSRRESSSVFMGPCQKIGSFRDTEKKRERDNSVGGITDARGIGKRERVRSKGREDAGGSKG